jgi:hypothetical protein
MVTMALELLAVELITQPRRLLVADLANEGETGWRDFS